MSCEQAEHVTNERMRTRRLFFALCPDEMCRQALVARMRRTLPRGSGRPVPAANLHLTLVFLGQLDETAVNCVQQAGGRVRARAFRIVLDHVGYWGRPRVLWLGPKHSSAPLFALVAALRDSLRKCPLSLDQRPYQAHMSLLRKAQPPAATIEFSPLDWDVRRFSLLESLSVAGGVRYRELCAWPLRCD